MFVLATMVALLQGLFHGDKTMRQLFDYVEHETRGVIVLNDGQVLPVLRKLEADRLVSTYGRDLTYDGNDSRDGRPGRYYRLTAAGVVSHTWIGRHGRSARVSD
jgi:DNA-binding PadR family transcriptional regulator